MMMKSDRPRRKRKKEDLVVGSSFYCVEILHISCDLCRVSCDITTANVLSNINPYLDRDRVYSCRVFLRYFFRFSDDFALCSSLKGEDTRLGAHLRNLHSGQ